MERTEQAPHMPQSGQQQISLPTILRFFTRLCSLSPAFFLFVFSSLGARVFRRQTFGLIRVSGLGLGAPSQKHSLP
jgi:hypothetical protein